MPTDYILKRIELPLHPFSKTNEKTDGVSIRDVSFQDVVLKSHKTTTRITTLQLPYQPTEKTDRVCMGDVSVQDAEIG